MGVVQEKVYKGLVLKSIFVQTGCCEELGCTNKGLYKKGALERGIKKGCCDRRVFKTKGSVIQKGSYGHGGVEKGSCVNGTALPSHCHEGAEQN